VGLLELELDQTGEFQPVALSMLQLLGYFSYLCDKEFQITTTSQKKYITIPLSGFLVAGRGICCQEETLDRAFKLYAHCPEDALQMEH
jgi:hypothetical protein